MATYLITGVSRGLGFEFLRQLSNNSANTVVGLVRDKATVEKKVSAELQNRQNIHIVQGDLTDYASLKKAVNETANITGGALDYVIANAADLSVESGWYPIGVLDNEPEKLEKTLLDLIRSNVIGNIHLFNLTIPLVLRGEAKKVIAISSGMADVDLAAKFDLYDGSLYSISKAALNMAVAKFSAQYAKEGVLIMTVSPGMVDTGLYNDTTDEQKQSLGVMMGKFMKYAPHFTGPDTPDVAVKLMISVMERAGVKAGDGGSSVSQYGNKQWL